MGGGAIAIDQNNPLFDDQKRGRGGKTNPTVSRSQPTDTQQRGCVDGDTETQRDVCERERDHTKIGNWKLDLVFIRSTIVVVAVFLLRKI